MKKICTILLVVELLAVFVSAVMAIQQQSAYVVIKVRYTSVKELSAFKEEVKALAQKKGILVDDINFKSMAK